jgi:hypothetical protein
MEMNGFLHALVALTHEKEHQVRDWVGSRVSLDMMVKIKKLTPARN